MVRPTSGERRLEALPCPTRWSVPQRSASTWCGCLPGRSVATVLLAGLGADARTLAAVAAVHPGRGLAREERGVLAVRSRKARELAASVPARARPPPSGAGDRAAVLVAQLERGTIGDAPTLERLLRDDVLGPEHVARGFLSDDEWDEAAGRAGRRRARATGPPACCRRSSAAS